MEAALTYSPGVFPSSCDLGNQAIFFSLYLSMTSSGTEECTTCACDSMERPVGVGPVGVEGTSASAGTGASAGAGCGAGAWASGEPLCGTCGGFKLQPRPQLNHRPHRREARDDSDASCRPPVGYRTESVHDLWHRCSYGAPRSQRSPLVFSRSLSLFVAATAIVTSCFTLQLSFGKHSPGVPRFAHSLVVTTIMWNMWYTRTVTARWARGHWQVLLPSRPHGLF
jgi:hypothetical protein